MMKFNSSRLICETINRNSFDNIFNLLRNENNTQYYFIYDKKYSDDEIKKKTIDIINFDREREIYFGIYIDDIFIGLLGLIKRYLFKHEYIGKVTCVNIIIDTKYQKKGYAEEVLTNLLQREYFKLKLFIIFGFKIYSSIYALNKNSLQLFNKLNFIKKIHSNNIYILEYEILSNNNELYFIYKYTKDEIYIKHQYITKTTMLDIAELSLLMALYIKYINVKFPYKKIKNPYKLFLNLVKYKSNYVKTSEFGVNYQNYFKTEYIERKMGYMISDKYGDYEQINVLTDFFQEKCRLKCKRYDMEHAPIVYWNTTSFLSLILLKMMEKKIDLTNYNIREYFYKNVYECGTFKLTVVTSILQIFKSKRILDISSGWGDRLIGAISRDEYIEYYHGCDPNTCVYKNYAKIIKYFNVNPKKYIIQNTGFENMKLDKTYDLIFTSPPYFDLEDYTQEGSQSIHTYDNLLDWLKKFLFFSLQKAWSNLETNGYMIISIEDKINEKMNIFEHYTEPMILFVNAFLSNAIYMGIIGHSGNEKTINKCRPLFVWQKQIIDNTIDKKKSLEYMKKYYPQIFNSL